MQQNDAVNVNLESIFIVISHEGQYSHSFRSPHNLCVINTMALHVTNIYTR